MSKPKKLYAHVLIDRSGSMATNVMETTMSINEYVGGLAGDPDLKANVSITLFDSIGGKGTALVLDSVCANVPASAVPKLTIANYQPRGGTPLNSAITKVVAQIEAEPRRKNETIVFAIMTDGEENSSSPEHTKESVKTLLDACRAKGWMVLYLGADHDAFKVAAGLGIAAGQTMQFDKMSLSASMGATRSMARSTSTYAGTGSIAEASFTADERDQSK